MQKYILILTKTEYVESFQQYKLIKTEQGFMVNFIRVEDERFHTFDKFKEFVRAKNPDVSQENAFYLLIGGSEFYYNIEPSLGDFQYAQCSDIEGDMSMYCTVGRIPGRDKREIEAVCNNILRFNIIPKSLLKLLPILATEKNRKFWDREFHSLYSLDTTSSTVSKAEVIAKIRESNFILHMGHGSRKSLRLRESCHLKVSDIPQSQSGYLHIWAWACSTCKNSMKGSLGENCLLQNKAVSFWGARKATYGDSNRFLYKSFMQELYDLTTDKPIGEIYFKEVMLKALRESNINYRPKIFSNAMKYTFLGDPTMLVKVTKEI
ncbi:C25 family cysteine peptidase [Phocaeicola faecalis]